MTLYFAYGSNINLNHLTGVLADHSVAPDDFGAPERAVLSGYRLRTNYYSCVHRAGACNIEPVWDGSVEGVLIETTPAIHQVLRRKEGWPTRYQEIEISVQVPATGETVRAFTYISTPENRLDFDLCVTPRYRQLILDGAKNFKFSQAYQKWLRVYLRSTSIRRVAKAGHAAENRPQMSAK